MMNSLYIYMHTQAQSMDYIYIKGGHSHHNTISLIVFCSYLSVFKSDTKSEPLIG